VTQWDWDPESYLGDMLTELADYPELQAQTAAASEGIEAKEILELGIGTGETARRILDIYPGAKLTAIDSSPAMLERARAAFPDADLQLSRLEDPLPAGPFDLVVTTLAVHHLDSDGKRDLFRRVARVLRPGGRFVLADLVVPERDEDIVTEIDWVMDLPDRLDDQLAWLAEAGFEAERVWTYKDLAVLRAMRPQPRG
jgi:tRNA (cmo5U34)-methyltransferase